MPWVPDFASAVELARTQVRAAGRADPVAQYFMALNAGDTRALHDVWPGEVVVFDPRAGEVRGHRQLRDFVHRNQIWLAEHRARNETIASTVAGTRAVVELLAHLDVRGVEVDWPVAVVAESPDDRSVTFRSYCSQWPISGQRQVRPAILKPEDVRPGDVVNGYLAALAAGDTERIVSTFAPDGYFAEPIGPQYVHRGPADLRTYFTRSFSAGGGIDLEKCVVTDDGVRCALEYSCIRWGSHYLTPQAGIGVWDRRPDGLLAAVRTYDDVEPPVS
jgi:ketosteroid isomerase-like protein